jgi:DNA-binding MarR family transcriptional regulator
MKSPELTPTQARILAHLQAVAETTTECPTNFELADFVGCDPTGTRGFLKALAAKGHIQVEKLSAARRRITIVATGRVMETAFTPKLRSLARG